MQEVKILGFENGVLNAALSGDIDLGNAEAFYQEIAAAYEQTRGSICFDCTELNFIDSTTLGTFVKILKMVKSDGFTLRLTNLQPKIKKLFVICSLDSIMELA
ncbi:MAG: STAS domain-containing protein [Clostridia bacterium]|nr:STAS domain-containing protein [Clostridia bacterium]